MSAELAYKIVSLRVGGGDAYLPHVRVYCGNCTSRLEFACSGHRPPEMIAKAVRHKGWEFPDLTNRRLVRCPDCITRRAVARKNDPTSLVELFGKPVELPREIIPEGAPHIEQPAVEPPPSPRPADYSNDFTYQPPKPPPPETPPPPAQNRLIRKPQPTPFAQQGHLIREYRIVLKTERQMLEIATALSGLGEVTALVLTDTEEAPSVVSASVQQERLPAPSPRPEPPLYRPPPPPPERDGRRFKSPQHVAAIKRSLVERQERVRKVLKEMRATQPQGREPSIDEYIRELDAAGLKPQGPGGKWNERRIRKQLAAIS